MRKLRSRQQGPCWEHTCWKGGVTLAFQDWNCCGVFGDRIKLIWGPRWQSRASGIQSGKLEASEVKGPDKWVLTLEDTWESNKPMACLPQNTWVICLSLFLIHTHRNIHISPKVNNPGSNFIEPCKQDSVFGLSSWTDVQSTVHNKEYSPFLSLGHSDAKEKALLFLTFLSIRWHQWDLAWLLVAPLGQKPRGHFDSLRWCFPEGQMF